MLWETLLESRLEVFWVGMSPFLLLILCSGRSAVLPLDFVRAGFKNVLAAGISRKKTGALKLALCGFDL